MATIALIIGAYLLGSASTANFLALTIKRTDLRNYGSGAVTSSNAGELLGKWAVVVSGIIDIFKAAGMVWCAQALALDPPYQWGVGLAVIAGHNWSTFMRFGGGRGLAPVIGLLMAISPVQFMILALTGFTGVAFFKNVPLMLGLSILLLPIWAFLLNGHPSMLWGSCIIVLVISLKRLSGNKVELPQRKLRSQVLLNRLLYDRDIRDRSEWIRRERAEVERVQQQRQPI